MWAEVRTWRSRRWSSGVKRSRLIDLPGLTYARKGCEICGRHGEYANHTAYNIPRVANSIAWKSVGATLLGYVEEGAAISKSCCGPSSRMRYAFNTSRP